MIDKSEEHEGVQGSKEHKEDGEHEEVQGSKEHKEDGEHKESDADPSFIRRQINQLIGTKSSAHESGFLMFPTVSLAPETSWDFGINSLYVYFANDNPKNRLSELNAYTFYTLKDQYGVWVDHTLYSDHNDWFFYGKARFQYFPLQYYGVGINTNADVKAIVDSDLFWFKERILRRVKGSLYLGFELEFRSTRNVRYRPKSGYEDLTPPLGFEDNTLFGVGLGVIYDSCHNAMNVRDGELFELGGLIYPSAFSDYEMGQLFFDARVFRPTTASQVIAMQLTGNFTFGDVPFSQLSTIGGPYLMRGYYTGRYQDRNMVAGQVEYRFLPFVAGSRFGAALFASAGTVSPDFTPTRVVWAVGLGPRVLLFPQKDIYSRFDFAFTEEGRGAYFYIGEAF